MSFFFHLTVAFCIPIWTLFYIMASYPGCAREMFTVGIVASLLIQNVVNRVESVGGSVIVLRASGGNGKKKKCSNAAP